MNTTESSLFTTSHIARKESALGHHRETAGWVIWSQWQSLFSIQSSLQNIESFLDFSMGIVCAGLFTAVT